MAAVFLQLFSFRENNHLEASLHLVSKEIILKMKQMLLVVIFPNKLTPQA